MTQIKQEILAIDVIDVAIIRVGPVPRPRIDQNKCITTIFKARLTLHDHWTLRSEGMASAKLRVEAIVGNVAALALRPRVTFLAVLGVPASFRPETAFLLVSAPASKAWLRPDAESSSHPAAPLAWLRPAVSGSGCFGSSWRFGSSCRGLSSCCFSSWAYSAAEVATKVESSARFKNLKALITSSKVFLMDYKGRRSACTAREYLNSDAMGHPPRPRVVCCRPSRNRL